MPVHLNNVSQINNTQLIKQQPKTTDENAKSFPTKTAVIVGAGLTALAAVGIYLATKGKVGKAVQQATHNTPEAGQNATNEVKTPNALSEIETLKEKIKTLRQTIKTNYQAERKELNKNSAERLNSYDCKQIGGMPKSEKDYDKVIRHLKEDNVEGYKLDEMNSVISDYRTKLKEKSKALAGDSEFQEIRKLRHKYINSSNLNNDECAITIKLIDDVLYSKANGKTSDYLESLGLSVDDAVQMIKNPKGAYKKIIALRDKACGVVGDKRPDAYMARMHSLENKRKNLGTTNGNPLNMEDLFDDMHVEAQNTKLNMSIRKGRLEHIEHLQQQKAQYKQKVIELSHKTRQSAEVQELKEALAKLKELESKEKNITSANNY